MARPVQGCCWPMRLERRTQPGWQPMLPGWLAWPVLVLQQPV